MKSPQIPNKLNNDPSQDDLRYMDDYLDQNADYPSKQNLQFYQDQQNYPSISNTPYNPNYVSKTIDDNNPSLNISNTLSKKQSSSTKNELNKISKRKTLIKQPKNTSSNNSMIKRIQSQSSKYQINYTKLYSKKSSQYKQIKFQTFQMIYKAFNMFNTLFLNFNEFILALKSIGIEIESQKRFAYIKNIYDQFVGKNQIGIDFQSFAKTSIKLLKQQKANPNSVFINLEKGYIYMVQQANHISYHFDQEDQSQNSNKIQFQQFKSYIQRLSTDKKYLNKDSLTHLIKYLNMGKQITSNDIDMIIKYADSQNKGYLTFQDFIKAIQTNNITQF